MRQALFGVSFIAVMVTLLAGCAAGGKLAEPAAISVIRPGSTLQLHQTLTIPAERARVYFQFGKVVGKLDVDQYHPSCNLLSYVVAEQPQIIQPDQFVVVAVSYNTELVGAGHGMLASGRLSGFGLFMNDDGPMAEIFTTILWLGSLKNPDIKRLECSEWREPLRERHLTLAEIRQALGTVIDINLTAGNV